jgi:hypothetical protein
MISNRRGNYTSIFSRPKRNSVFKCLCQCSVQNAWCIQIRSGTFIVVLVLNYFQGHVVQEDDCLTLKRKALQSYKSSGTTQSTMLHHISDYWNFKVHSLYHLSPVSEQLLYLITASCSLMWCYRTPASVGELHQHKMCISVNYDLWTILQNLRPFSY